ncbi:podocan-like [Teleopsis dalmanni]|uniref:podocan-like n=2 Tax=Teleopsis dalmanni TaxID=139649 RepID=UPI0018CDF121|nr:podocan-like [Teleopsis dalmanni]
MASLIYTVLSITNVASVHCAARPEISPCTCDSISLYNLKFLELTCEKVDSFHQIVDKLSNKFDPNLNISLKITYSQLEDMEMLSFKDMNLNVNKLRLQWNNLRTLPELPFRGLSNVEFLSIGDNELETIPKHMLSHMPLIKTLDMGRCRLKSVLQDDFKGTQMVKFLFLVTNEIKRLEKGTFPQSLVSLHLGRNQIESLNGTLRNLNQLESLFLNMNNIKSLDDELPESNRLQLIIAFDNQLEHLPESMRYMTNLETLHVHSNRIRSLDGKLKNAKKLNEFYGHYNKIEYLAQDEFKSVVKMEEIRMDFNNIKSLNCSLLPMKRITKVNFSFNEIEEFSMNEIRGLMYLKTLDLSYNRIETLTGRQDNSIDKASVLVEFNLDHNRLKSLDAALMGLDSLRILTLSYNEIEQILPEDFIGMVHLELLDLSHNQLLTLQELETTRLPNLKILKAPFNNLTKLERDFHGLPVLCQVNVTNNQIATISAELVKQSRCLSHNVLNDLEIHLEDNPIMCDQRLNELCQMMQRQNASIRGSSQCFTNKKEVCSALEELYKSYPSFLLQNIDITNTKELMEVIIPRLINPDENLPPIITPLGKAVINTPPIIKTITKTVFIPSPSALTTTTTSTTSTTTTTTTTTTTPAPTTTSTAEQENINIESEGNENTQNETPKLTESSIDINNNNTHNQGITMLPIGADFTTTTSKTITNFDMDIYINESKHINTPVVFNIDEASIITTNLTNSTNPILNENDTIAASENAEAPSVSKSGYATVEYIPNSGNFLSSNNAVNALVEETNSNSVHEEYHSVILADLDGAPKSILILKEPPENP